MAEIVTNGIPGFSGSCGLVFDRAESYGQSYMVRGSGSPLYDVDLHWNSSWPIAVGPDTFCLPAHLAIQLQAMLTGYSSTHLLPRTSFAGQGSMRESRGCLGITREQALLSEATSSLHNGHLGGISVAVIAMLMQQPGGLNSAAMG
jgi:hypothetical protein